MKPKLPLQLILVLIGLVVSFGVGYYVPMGRIQRLNEEAIILNESNIVLNEQISALNKQITAFQENLAEKNTQISILEVEIDEQISGLNVQITAFQENLAEKNTQISILEVGIDELESQIFALRSELDSRESQILELQTFVPPSVIKAPEFSITDIDGESFTLSEHLGEIVIIDFMATWCGDCELKIPEYVTLQEMFGDLIVIISINVDPSSDSDESLRIYTNQLDAPWTWAIDNGNITDLYGVQSIPTTYIVDNNGYVWSQYVGFVDSEVLGLEIEQLLSYRGSYYTPAFLVTISARDAKELIDSNPDAVILDVRTTSEFGEEHLESAVNIPVQELQERIGELVKNNLILVYCKTGFRSAQASQILVNNGFMYIYDLDGGITAWKNKHLPVVIVP